MSSPTPKESLLTITEHLFDTDPDHNLLENWVVAHWKHQGGNDFASQPWVVRSWNYGTDLQPDWALRAIDEKLLFAWYERVGLLPDGTNAEEFGAMWAAREVLRLAEG